MTKTYAHDGHHYCFVLTAHGWRNQGMVPDNNRQPFIDEYKAKKGTRVAFSPFCWTENPNVLQAIVAEAFETHITHTTKNT